MTYAARITALPLPDAEFSLMVESYYGNEWMRPTTGYVYYSDTTIAKHITRAAEVAADADAELTALRGRVEELERDALRYRWLIENSFDRAGVTQIHCWLHEWEPHSKTGEPTEWMSRVRGPAIERVIDAAISKGKEAGATA